MVSDLELLRSSERDLVWFNENSQILRDKFAEQIVAIKDKSIVGNARNIKILLKILKEKGVDESEVLIESLAPSNEIIIL